MTDAAVRRRRFADLHRDGIFVMPNAWDAGSARLLEHLGFPAIATTSSGHAASLGKVDQSVTLDELLAHVTALVAVLEVPLSVDAERCFADDAAGVAETMRLLAESGASGCSIEDWDPARGSVDALHAAVERVESAAEAAHRFGMTFTARAENHLYGIGDLDDTIKRLRAYRAAGADVLYAPGLTDADDIARVAAATDAPVNVLAMRRTPPVPQLAALGVRRVSTGGGLTRVAFGALRRAAEELREAGTTTYLDDAITGDELDDALR
jgi:2-methylisocitrate lyase-like PEP mutase family enzyme